MGFGVEIGLAISQYGRFASLDSIRSVAQESEALGFASLWVGDRLMTPLSPRDPYPAGDGTIPPDFATFLDPVAVLSVAAAHTTRVRLGASALNACWYPPAILARSLATVDHLSGGRLNVGLGLGWSSDEYAAVGVPWRSRAARFEAVLDVLDTIWTTDPVSYEDEHWRITPSRIHPKPERRPPLYLAGFAPAVLRRIGRRADGWLTAAMPLPALTAMWDTVRQSAEEAGRDPDALRMVMRCNPAITETPSRPEALPPAGTVTQLTDYLRSAADAGVHEIILDFQQTARDDRHLLDLAAEFITTLK
ncbi:TIGR03619 family F420-dependent LLM class oxidoreductase [Sinosporangium siamense]|uniref:LLM class F420-dependent oxidoreductase n=2 Tax=Sinosporangium siamense TaxID=1367973 RepID=A0A919RCK7_9ACTN|nr:TIGR03619 family F420-dependent LLM class oxidoreductase [Sinosporangium siamense]GII91178.1 LLM class F420-dependent oxidoreductase [Sinosporangium siamense]